jgi:hypothetical protein
MLQKPLSNPKQLNTAVYVNDEIATASIGIANTPVLANSHNLITQYNAETLKALHKYLITAFEL